MSFNKQRHYVLCSTADTIRIANENIPTPKVQERYRRLDFEHVTYVMDSIRETTTKIKNIRGYLLTALYYAPITIGPIMLPPCGMTLTETVSL